MKITLGIVMVFFVGGAACAQYIPHTSQPFQFASLYNPAFSGVENYGDLKLGYRYQWTGFKDSAPTFGNLLFNMRVKQPLDLKLNAPRSSVSSFNNIIPQRKLTINGLGVNVFNESIGPIKRVGGGGSFALHMPVSKKIFVSGGLGVMVENTKLKGEDLYWGESVDTSDEIYISLLNASSNHTELWLRTGVLVYSEDFYFGFSYFPWNTNIKTSDMAFMDAFYKGSIQAGMSFPLEDGSFIRPSVVALIQTNGDLLIDLFAKFYLERKAWFGLGYRNVKSGMVNAGLTINEKFAASYSYEFSLGKLRQFSGGSHDLILSMRINNFKQLDQRTF